MKEKQSYGIFEPVQFINEGVGLAIFAGLAALPFVISGALALYSDIALDSAARKLSYKLRTIFKENKDINNFDIKVKGVREISVNALYKYFKKDLDKEELEDFKHDDIRIYGMYDNNDKLIAYLWNNYSNGKYAFYIDPKYKNNKDIVNYTMARFELAQGIVNDGIRYFIPDADHTGGIRADSNKFAKRNKIKSGGPQHDDNDDDFNAAITEFEKFGKALLNYLKNSSLGKYMETDEYGDKVDYESSLNKCITKAKKDFNSKEETNVSHFFELYIDFDKDDYESIIKELNSLIERFAKTNKFGEDVEYDDIDYGHEYSKSSKYPYIGFGCTGMNADDVPSTYFYIKRQFRKK